MKRIVLSILVLFIAGGVFAQQDIPFEKAYFKDRKQEFKEAEDHITKGDELLEMYGPVGSKGALEHYLKANKFNPNSSSLNYKIGKCYLNSTYKLRALEYLEKAEKLKRDVAPDLHYLIGQSYHLRLEWDKAINEYRKYLMTLSGKDAVDMKGVVDKKIAECEIGKKLVKDPKRVFIDNVGAGVNTKYPEYGAIISADNSVMLFTSRRPNSTGGLKDDLIQEYMEDIYMSVKKDGEWQPAVNIGEPANSAEHDATVALSPDGQKMIIYNDDKGDGNLYEVIREGNTWSKPKKLGKNINTKGHESSAAYSGDGKTLYFVSNREDLSMGEHDIFKSEWNFDKEEWGEPVNLGPTINTKYDDEGVFMHPDGKTMYFSSKGHETMGGFDIFKSEWNGTSWTKPENVGYPINTADDDVFFVIDASGRYGYFSSVKKEGYGEKDIYKITFLGPEKPAVLSGEDNLLASVADPIKEKVIEKEVQLETKKITILKGTITVCGASGPLEAQIELIDVEQNKTLATFKSNKSTGSYLVSLPSGKNYGIAVKKDGYLFHSENFNIPASAAFQQIVKDICLKRIEVGSAIVLKNIFYDYNKATLRQASMNELDRLVKLLNDNPTLKIELSAHTDSRGSDSYNEKLSQERAQSCVNYLNKKGISGSRLVAKGYGEKVPIVSEAEIKAMKTEEEKEYGHQQNRRTEFKILSK